MLFIHGEYKENARQAIMDQERFTDRDIPGVNYLPWLVRLFKNEHNEGEYVNNFIVSE